MQFQQFRIRTSKLQSLYRAVATDDKMIIRAYGLTEDRAVSSIKLSILKYTAIISKSPVILYQPSAKTTLFLNKKARELFIDEDPFISIPDDQRELLDTIDEFELEINENDHYARAITYWIPEAIRYFQIEGRLTANRDRPRMSASNQGEV
jgi:hypothetical protein